MGIEIDRTNHVPIFWQIKQDLHKKILSGFYKVEEQIPSESKLAEKYKVNRLTARSAVTELVNEGLLYRRQGQGTFVCRQRIETGIARLSSFMNDMKEKGYSVFSEVLVKEEKEPSAQMKEYLKIHPGDTVYNIKRLRFANGEPIVLQDAFIPSQYCSGLLDYNFEKVSLYETLKNNYSLDISHASESLEARIADDEQADYLRVSKNSPILFSFRLTMLDDDTPIECVTSLYRSDRYKFEIKLSK